MKFDKNTGICNVIITKITDYGNGNGFASQFNRSQGCKAKINLLGNPEFIFEETEGAEFDKVTFDLTEGEFEVFTGVSGAWRLHIFKDKDNTYIASSRQELLEAVGKRDTDTDFINWQKVFNETGTHPKLTLYRNDLSPTGGVQRVMAMS